ncbi:XRE family transcriptional regulator [Amycolatopsis magusensis]|uniref:XRE family transcriptional regulator n=1 Tax=Amycolatopsis magusensis TaxID=882444 RepID=UPI0037B3520F
MTEAPELKDVINQLFATIRRPDGKEWTLEEVAKGCRNWLQATFGSGTFSVEYVRQLKLGLRTNPTKNHLEALAGFFGVDPAIFLPTERGQQILADLELLAALKSADVVGVALRTYELSPGDRAKVRDFVDALVRERAAAEET